MDATLPDRMLAGNMDRIVAISRQITSYLKKFIAFSVIYPVSVK